MPFLSCRRCREEGLVVTRSSIDWWRLDPGQDRGRCLRSWLERRVPQQSANAYVYFNVGVLALDQ